MNMHIAPMLNCYAPNFPIFRKKLSYITHSCAIAYTHTHTRVYYRVKIVQEGSWFGSFLRKKAWITLNQ